MFAHYCRTTVSLKCKNTAVIEICTESYTFSFIYYIYDVSVNYKFTMQKADLTPTHSVI